MQLPISDGARLIMAKLQKSGFATYIVGGAVRDILRGETPADYDLTTAAHPYQILGLFQDAHTTGGNYGTVTVRLSQRDYEVTPFRSEGAYSDARHPDSVVFKSDIHADLSRRDFTVNALAYDGRTLIDDFDGYTDLQNKTLRCIGTPALRFGEDALRILRLFRFGAQLGFAFEEATLQTALQLCPTLATVSSARVRQELTHILQSKYPQAVTALINAGGLCSFGIAGPAHTDMLAQICKLPTVPLLRWWAFLRFSGADYNIVQQKLCFKQSTLKAWLLLDKWFAVPCTTLQEVKRRLSAQPLFCAPEDIFTAFALLCPSGQNQLALFEEISAEKQPYLISHLAVSGQDLLAYDVKGKDIGRCLSALLNVVIENPQLNHYDALVALIKSDLSALCP